MLIRTRTPACLFAVVFVARAVAAQGPIDVRVDQRFELVSIVFRLAGFEEYRMGSVADYNEAVDGYVFQDRTGAPLRPMKVGFKTRAQ
jgi:hypothetical protein